LHSAFYIFQQGEMTKFNITKEEKLKDLIGYVHKIRMKRFKGLSGY